MSSLSQSTDRPWLGASWKIAAFGCYAGLNAIAKYLTGNVQPTMPHVSVYVLVFFQDLFALLILLPWMLKRGKIAFIPDHIGLHLFRALTSAVAIIAWYFTLVHMALAEAVALSIIGPIAGILGAKWFLKEKLGALRGKIILFTLVGALILLRPEMAWSTNKSNVTGLFFYFCLQRHLLWQN